MHFKIVSTEGIGFDALEDVVIDPETKLIGFNFKSITFWYVYIFLINYVFVIYRFCLYNFACKMF